MEEQQQESPQPQEPQEPRPSTPVLRWVSYVLYLPLFGGLGFLILLCVLLLGRGKPAGAFGALYATMFFFLGRRYWRIYSGELDGPQLWKDVILLGIVDLMLTVLWIERVS